jgi:diphthamide synthase (EF-2-diphthine--ammonia ligase)
MKTLVSWSSGKDSAWALHVLGEQTDIEVVGLFTTLNGAFDRVAMHAVGFVFADVLESPAAAG